jgi:hypothetical protein
MNQNHPFMYGLLGYTLLWRHLAADGVRYFAVNHRKL